MNLPNEILQVCFDIHEKVKTPSEGQEEILRLFDVGQGEQLKAFVEWWHGLSQEELAWYDGRYVEVFLSL